MFNDKQKTHDAKLGICIIAHVGDRFSPLSISDNLIVALDESRWVLFPNFRKSCYNFISRKLIKLMGSFSPIHSQTPKRRPYFFGINRRAILSFFFCSLAQFSKSFKLTKNSNSIFSFSNFSEFF